MRTSILCVVLLAGCEAVWVSDGTRSYYASRQWIDTEKQFSLETPDGTRFGAAVRSKVDSEAIRATGDAAANVLGQINGLLLPMGLKVGELRPNRQPVAVPPEIADLRRRLNSQGLDVVGREE